MLILESGNLPQNYFPIYLITVISHKRAFFSWLYISGAKPKRKHTEYTHRTGAPWEIQFS